MEKNLRMQYDALSQSISKLNFVTSQFMMKMNEVSDEIAAQFKKNKKQIKITKEFTPNIDQYTSRDLIAYQDSLMHRFKSTYELTLQFLKSYTQETFSTKTDSIEEILQSCKSKKLINASEYSELLTLFTQFEEIFKENENEISEDIIHYCLLMQDVVERFEKN
jgi:hypothetical protein